jgi:predicted nucleotidyltransferase component of viral defense system
MLPMSLFDELVDQALNNKPELAPLRVVVEKELLHHDIVRVLAKAGLLSGLTFMGGTCLRACYGSSRLSEDLDFTGGADFTREMLAAMAGVLVQSLKAKYGLNVVVTEPMREVGNVDTWKIKVQTRPGRKDLPAQRINIDVCAIASHQPRPMMLLNPYGVEMGTSGLVLQAQSREEIFADKLVAFALHPNRIKNRDLWDIAWLHQQQVRPALAVLSSKLSDHQAPTAAYLQAFSERAASMQLQPAMVNDFRFEMRRFLPNQMVKDTVESDDFWAYLCGLMHTYTGEITQALTGQQAARVFKM